MTIASRLARVEAAAGGTAQTAHIIAENAADFELQFEALFLSLRPGPYAFDGTVAGTPFHADGVLGRHEDNLAKLEGRP